MLNHLVGFFSRVKYWGNAVYGWGKYVCKMYKNLIEIDCIIIEDKVIRGKTHLIIYGLIYLIFCQKILPLFSSKIHFVISIYVGYVELEVHA